MVGSFTKPSSSKYDAIAKSVLERAGQIEKRSHEKPSALAEMEIYRSKVKARNDGDTQQRKKDKSESIE